MWRKNLPPQKKAPRTSELFQVEFNAAMDSARRLAEAALVDGSMDSMRMALEVIRLSASLHNHTISTSLNNAMVKEEIRIKKENHDED